MLGQVLGFSRACLTTGGPCTVRAVRLPWMPNPAAGHFLPPFFWRKSRLDDYLERSKGQSKHSGKTGIRSYWDDKRLLRVIHGHAQPQLCGVMTLDNSVNYLLQHPKNKKLFSSSKFSQVQIKPLESSGDNLLNYRTNFLKMLLDTRVRIDVIYTYRKAFELFKRCNG